MNELQLLTAPRRSTRRRASGTGVAARLSAGLLLAVLAAGSATALLGLSGWFLTTCAAAGLGAAGAFSWVLPAAGVRALAATRVVSRYGERLATHGATLALLGRLRSRLFAGAAALPTAHLARFRSGDLLARVTSDVDALDLVVLRVALPAVVAGTAGTAGVAVLAVLAPGVVLPVGALLALAGVAVPYLTHRRGRGAAEQLAGERAQARALLVEALDGLPELVSCAATEHARSRIASALHGAGRAQRRSARLDATGQAATAALSGAAVLTVVWICGLPGPDRLRPALGVLCFLLVAGLFELVEPLPAAWRARAGSRAAATRLSELLDTETHRDADVPATTTDDVFPAGGYPPPDIPLPAIGLAAATVQHEPGGNCLGPFTLTVDAGTTLVVTGPSGAGKTTLLRLLAGELVPTDGVTRGGNDRMSGLPGVRLALVGQDSHIFDATLAENLRLAAPEAGDAELLEVLEAVDLLGSGGLPHALETAVGAHGQRLSGGQRRRLSLAQGLLRRPDVLLLDEPTEGLDAPTARRVLAVVRARLPRATLVLAVHDRLVDHLPFDPDQLYRLAGHPTTLRTRPRSSPCPL